MGSKTIAITILGSVGVAAVAAIFILVPDRDTALITNGIIAFLLLIIGQIINAQSTHEAKDATNTVAEKVDALHEHLDQQGGG